MRLKSSYRVLSNGYSRHASHLSYGVLISRLIMVLLCTMQFKVLISVEKDGAVLPGLPITAIVRWEEGKTRPSIFGIQTGMTIKKATRVLMKCNRKAVPFDGRADMLQVKLEDGSYIGFSTSSDTSPDAIIESILIHCEMIKEQEFIKLWTSVTYADSYDPVGHPPCHRINDEKLKLVGEAE